MKHGTQTKLAKAAEITIAQVHHYLNGRKNASVPVADRLAALTGSDIRVWLQGGSVEARRAALDAWSERTERKPSEAQEMEEFLRFWKFWKSSQDKEQS